MKKQVCVCGWGGLRINKNSWLREVIGMKLQTSLQSEKKKGHEYAMYLLLYTG